MKKTVLLALAVVLAGVASAQTPLSKYDLNRPIGWGAIGDSTVTGGEGGDEVVVTNEQELDDAINKNAEGKTDRSCKRIIYIKGQIEITKLHTYHVQNKTIYGLPGSKLYNTHQSKGNGGVMKFTSGSQNIILRNITIEGPGAYDVDGDDALLFQECSRIWVDHCDIMDGLDSNLDANNGSDYLSITWTRFRYLKDPKSGGSGGAADHRFCCTWGASDKKKDVSGGKLNTTFANCWWGEGVMERAPRVRFGKVHVVNCYYTNTGNHYCLGYGYLSNIYAENCYFADGVTVAKDYTTPKKGYGDYNLQIVGCHNSSDVKQNSGSVEYFQPSKYYSYTAFPADDVPAVVGDLKTGAGATLMVEVGKGVTGYASGDVTPTAIDAVNANVNLAPQYYTADGVRLLQPQRGLNIVRQPLYDGTFKVSKTIIR